MHIGADQEWLARAHFEQQRSNAAKDIKPKHGNGQDLQKSRIMDIYVSGTQGTHLWDTPRGPVIDILSLGQKPDHQLVGSTGQKQSMFGGIWTDSQGLHDQETWHVVIHLAKSNKSLV